MSITTLVLGQSGTGKTASLRNLDPAKVALIKATEKPLPFRAAGWNQYTTDAWAMMIQAARKAVANGKEIVVVDDFQYLMANEFMRPLIVTMRQWKMPNMAREATGKVLPSPVP